MMDNISMVESKLPPGFMFHPRDEELVCDYLLNKVSQLLSPNFHERETHDPLLIEVDLNKCEPWDLPDTTRVKSKEWYFYSRRDRKYATGLRTNRATATGYWKATGKDKAVLGKGSALVGMRKTLVFYQGRAPKGRKTEWVMHEFRLEGPFAPPHLSSLKEDWVLCRVFYKTSKETTTSATQRLGNNTGIITCYDHTGSASSLPPLMDLDSNNYITFNQSDHHHHHHHEQVPCFSIFNQSQTTPNIHLPHTITNHMEQQPLNTMISNKINNFIMNPFGENNRYNIQNENHQENGTRSCLERRKVFTEISNDNCSLEGDEQTCLLGGDQAGSSESYLSDVGDVHNMWNH